MQVEDGGAMKRTELSIAFVATGSEREKESEDIPRKVNLDDWDSESIQDVPEAEESQTSSEKGE